ncbi:MAG: glycoside hydrolase family 88 protein [Massilia sp.]
MPRLLPAVLLSTRFVLAAPATVADAAAAAAASDPPPASALGTRLSNAIISRYSPTIEEMGHYGWDHSNSAVLHGMQKVYQRTRDPAILNYIRAYADLFVRPDGSIRDLHHNLDGMHPGVLCLFLYQETGERKYLAAARTMRDIFIGTPDQPSTFKRTAEGGYWHKSEDHYKNVMSVDGTYMVYPFLVQYAVVAKEPALLDVATAQILMVASHSFNTKFNLQYHGWDYGKAQPWANPITGTSSQFWSRSAGWFSMTLVDVLEALPKEHRDYARLLFLYRSLAQGVKAAQKEDGFWYDVLDAPAANGNFAETSGTGMIVYALQKGVNLGLLDGAYRDVARRGWGRSSATSAPSATAGRRSCRWRPAWACRPTTRPTWRCGRSACRRARDVTIRTATSRC